MRVLKSSYDADGECFVVRIDGRAVVIPAASGRPIEPVSVDEIAVEIENTLWVCYPSRKDDDEHTYLVIVMVSPVTGERVAPVLVSEPLSHAIASDHLDVARKQWAPLTELPQGVQWQVDFGAPSA